MRIFIAEHGKIGPAFGLLFGFLKKSPEEQKNGTEKVKAAIAALE